LKVFRAKQLGSLQPKYLASLEEEGQVFLQKKSITIRSCTTSGGDKKACTMTVSLYKVVSLSQSSSIPTITEPRNQAMI